jgi:son of sevenless
MDIVYSYGRDAVGQVSYLLTVLNTVNVARHVDLDCFGSEAGPGTEAYTQSVLSARNTIRMLEATTQSLYDDGAALLLVIESLPPAFLSSLQARHSPLLGVADRQIDSALTLLTSMRTNLAATLVALETLLAIGYDQENMARGQHKGSIEWRMSRLTIVDRSLLYNAIAIDGSDIPHDTDDEDVLDLEDALSRPTGPSRMQPQISQHSDELNQGRYAATHSRDNGSMSTFRDNASSTMVSHADMGDDDLRDDMSDSEETIEAADDFGARPSLDDFDEDCQFIWVSLFLLLSLF